MASPNSVLPPKDKEAQDSIYNPAEQAYLEGMATGHTSSGIDQAEAFANDPNNHDSAKPVREAESNPDENLSGGLYKPSPKGKRQKIVLKAVLKNKTALTAIITLVFGAGLGFSALLSPSLLIIHMKEIMVEKFDTSIGSVEARTGKLLNSQIGDSTAGLCAGKVTLKCKFSTMSKKQVANFKNAGITVLPEESNTLGGRTKPTSYVFNEKTITANDFAALSKSDPNFRTALRKAYNPKFAIFSGKAWKATAAFLGISKKPVDVSGATDEERMKKLNAAAENGDTGRAPKVAADFEDDDCTGANCATAAEKAKAYNDGISQVDADAKTPNAGKNAIEAAEESISAGKLSGFTSIFKLTGVVDDACQVYGAVNAVGYAAKTIRAVQLARYAMAFITLADQIKAGDSPDPADVAFMGGVLTEVAYDVGSTTKRIKSGAATDSFGFKYAAYGDTTASSSSMTLASRYLAGGGFVGQLIEVTNTITQVAGGGDRGVLRNTCKTLSNPWVQAGSIAGGIAMLFVPGANIGKIALGATTGIAFQVGLAILPSLLADIVAGTVTENITSEASGNAITGGSGKIMSDTLAGQTGNALMSAADASDYLNLNNKTVAMYAEDEKNSLSPLDPTSRHTFIGSIVSQLIPTVSSVSNVGSALTSLSSLLKTSFASIIPTTNAVTTAQSDAALKVCQDSDSLDAGYATDPFCNVIRGIPPKYLNKDPQLVIDQLGAQLSSTGIPTGAYKTFIEKCITNTDSPGYDSSGTFYPELAQDCMINDNNANYYLNWADQRIKEGMDDEEEADTAPVISNERPADTDDRGDGGWTLRNGVDYSTYNCDPRTQDIGMYTNPNTNITIRQCAVAFNAGSYGSLTDATGGQSSIVASVISGNVMDMFEAARVAGIELGISDGLRHAGGADYNDFSQHGRGLGIDIGNPRSGATICFRGGGWGTQAGAEAACSGNAAFAWLKANAPQYGFQNLKFEPWHWSMGES